MDRLKRPLPWIAFGLIFPLVNIFNASPPRSPLWFLEWFLYLLLVILVVADRATGRLHRSSALIAYLALSLLFAAGYELSLTVDGTGLGGYHEETASSFILASGFYIPAALFATWTVRHWKTDFSSMFLFSLGVSLNEALIFRPVLLETLLSPNALIAPVLLAFYAVIYAIFYALPVLIIAPASLHRERATPAPGAFRMVLWGAFAGLVCNLFMGLVHAPLAMKHLNMAPTLGG